MLQIGIIGAGVMGTGIAQAFLEYGFTVKLVDVSQDILDTAKKNIHRNILVARMSGASNVQAIPDIDKLLVTDSSLALVADCDFVIESVTEKEAVKKEIYQKADAFCGPDTIIMSNTSCVSITKLASFTNRPKQVIGTHFMNPVPFIHTIEVVRGEHTSQDTVTAVSNLLGEIGKESVVIRDLPGFVSNRISHLMMNEAAFLVQDQVAGAKEIDLIFKNCYGHKMGPLETADLIGLDTVVDSLQVLYDSYQDSKFRCCPLLKRMVMAGYLGVKSGQGFYSY